MWPESSALRRERVQLRPLVAALRVENREHSVRVSVGPSLVLMPLLVPPLLLRGPSARKMRLTSYSAMYLRSKVSKCTATGRVVGLLYDVIARWLKVPPNEKLLLTATAQAFALMQNLWCGRHCAFSLLSWRPAGVFCEGPALQQNFRALRTTPNTQVANIPPPPPPNEKAPDSRRGLS